MSLSGVVRWPPEAPVWTFTWEMIDGNSEAIAFRNVAFKGKKVLHKASLPMIRVHYDSGDGPYKDQLSTGNLRGPVKVAEHVQNGFRHLVVESYHEIGRYRLVNRWFFRHDGLVLPQLHSAGLQHPANHRHHVYWRFDFDIEQASRNLALQHPLTSTNWGYGAGWIPRGRELATIHIGDNRWAVMNKDSGRGYLISRGQFDGASDWFGTIDVAVLAYHGNEDLTGALGTAWDDKLATQVTGEDIDGKDVVLWYVAHLGHVVHDSGDEWHVCGPLLFPFGF